LSLSKTTVGLSKGESLGEPRVSLLARVLTFSPAPASEPCRWWRLAKVTKGLVGPPVSGRFRASGRLLKIAVLRQIDAESIGETYVAFAIYLQNLRFKLWSKADLDFPAPKLLG
jgi:hypothetical protein